MATAAAFASRLPIAQLQPGLDIEATSVTGVVTLIWPYASSTQSISLLLVEPDFRLRGHRGQVRVHFNGASARAVARSGLSSGDRLSLSLKGSAWTQDGSSTTTPGRSIEWELRYGERVLLQIQRDSQEPEILDIDHSLTSPNTLTATLSSRQSIPYQTHSVTGTPAPLLSGQTWESPAFLKRSHAKSSYDPFAIEDGEEDFPDNDRRKRSKFGRGSGQWRFADRTPSPEKSRDLDEREMDSPLKPNVGDRAIDEAAYEGFRKVQQEEVREKADVEEQDLQKAPKEAEVQPDTGRDFKDLGRKVRESHGGLDDKGALNAPPSPPSTTSETSGAEALETMTPTKSSTPMVTRSSTTRSINSVSESSASDQEPESDGDEPVAEHSDGAAFRASASDFGLDGAVFSSIRPSQQDRRTSESIIEETERMTHDTIRHLPKSEYASLSPSDSRGDRRGLSTEPTTIKETAHEFQILEDNNDASIDTYVQEAVETHPRNVSSAPSSPSSQLEEQATLDASYTTCIKTQSDMEQLKLQPPSTALDSNEFEDALKFVEPQETTEDGVATTGQSPTSRVTQVEIIDLESDDEDNEEDEAHKVVHESDLSPRTASKNLLAQSLTNELPLVDSTGTPIKAPPTAFRTPSLSAIDLGTNASPYPDAVERSPLAERDPQSPGPKSSNTSSAADPANGGATQLDSHNDSRDEKRLSPQQTASLVPQELLHQSEVQVPDPRENHEVNSERPEPELSDRQSPRLDDSTSTGIQPEVASSTQQALSSPKTDLKASPKLTSGLATAANSQDSFLELPATVQDSALQLPSSKGQLLTPDTTQQTSFGSQQSMNSLYSISDDDKPITPLLTKSKSDDIIVPIALQAVPEKLSPVRSPPSPKKSGVQAEKTRSPEKASTPQRPSTLIEKLKAMKRLSNQNAQHLGDPSVTSPWFTPRKSSIVVPDSEAESEVESLFEDDRQSTRPVIKPNFQTPERQKPLAKAFVRSPNQQEAIQSITSSPGYLPPSQPPPPGFRTSLSYFVPLATLQSHFTLAVDILAIVVYSTSVTRATSGPKDYNQSIYISDPSSSFLGSPIVTAQIFRSHNKCFPLLEQGDALLLRDFKVQSFQKQLSLLSTQSSAWAVFRRDAEVQVRGPPVEFGAEERGFARGLWRWWAGLDRRVKDGLGNATPRKKEKEAIPPSKQPRGETPTKEKRFVNGENTSDVKIKKQSIAGLGVDLPGSQEKTRKHIRKEKFLEPEANSANFQDKPRQQTLKDDPGDMDKVLESTEPPKRVLRPRGAKGKAERSESPMKAINRRSGTVFEGGLGEPKSRFSV